MKKNKWGIFALIGKVGPKILSLLGKLAKTLKLSKVTLAGASLASYAVIFTWQFALMIIFMLFVHESGHVWAMKRIGMKTKGFYFIPLLGGAAIADEAFPSRKAEVFVAIMGPIFGLTLSIATFLVYLTTSNPIFAAGASWMAMINLFNLLPINPLDGGRIFKSIAFSINSKIGLAFLAIGVIAAGILGFTAGFGLFWFLLIIGSIDLALEYRNRNKLHQPPMNRTQTAGSAAGYAILSLVLWGIMALANSVPGAQAAMEFLKS